jgi:hypothetical protein
MFSQPFVGHGEISVAVNPHGNHVEVPLVAAKTGSPRLVKIFIKFECLEFDESSR